MRLRWFHPLGLMVLGLLGLRTYQWLLTGVRVLRLRRFLNAPMRYAHWRIPAGRRCRGAPFRWPTTGYPGFLRHDAWALFHWHTGVDIFSGRPPGEEPVYAVYPGWLYRFPHWRATVAIRHEDPLRPGHFLWSYYTHMADAQGRSFIVEDFPPGTQGVWVEAGTLLGYQGNYSGTPSRPVGVHLHLSLVRDVHGSPANEARIWNTLDPSPYFGLSLNAWVTWRRPVCR